MTSFTVAAQDQQKALVSGLKTAIEGLINVGTLKDATTQALSTARDKLKPNTSINEAVKIGKEALDALGKDSYVPEQIKSTFETVIAALEQANAGTTPKGSIVLYGAQDQQKNSCQWTEDIDRRSYQFRNIVRCYYSSVNYCQR